MLKRFRSEKGITGLETAIILIAFVVVAAVFAYTALSAGLFSTQKKCGGGICRLEGSPVNPGAQGSCYRHC